MACFQVSLQDAADLDANDVQSVMDHLSQMVCDNNILSSLDSVSFTYVICNVEI